MKKNFLSKLVIQSCNVTKKQLLKFSHHKLIIYVSEVNKNQDLFKIASKLLSYNRALIGKVLLSFT